MLIICYTVIIFVLFLLPPAAIFWHFEWLLATVCQYDVLLVGVGVGMVLIVVLNNEIQQPTIPMVVVQLNEYVATL